MKIEVLELNQNSAQVRIESDVRGERGVWLFQNLAPYQNEFTSLINDLANSSNPSEILVDIRRKYRGRIVGVF